MSEKQQNPIIKRLSSSLSQCYDKPEDRNIEVEEIYSSLYDQKYAILKSTQSKYFLYDLSQNLIVRYLDQEHINISLSFNEQFVFYIKNGGCFVTKAKVKDENFSLFKSQALLGNLNKKIISKFALGKGHTLILTQSGIVYCLGDNSFNQLGIIRNTQCETPTMLTTLLNYRVIDIACGSYHSLAIGVIRDKVKNELNSVDKKLDLLFVWGNNSRGQLGIEEEEKITIPTINDYCEFRDLCKISCGLEHSAILLKSGKAYLMGDNTKKQISISLLKNGITKVSKPLLISFKEGQNSDIHCTANSTYIILENGFIVPLGEAYTNGSLIKIENSNIKLLYKDNSIHYYSKLSQTTFDEVKIVNQVLEKQSDTDFEYEPDNPKVNILMGNPHKYIFLQNLNRSKNTFDEKDFNSDNDSTNEILESNFSSRIDHPKEELRSYISLIGMSFPSECLGTSMEGLSFRPSNLEPKSKSELEHHKEMIEEHRKLYFNHLKEKFQQEKQLKDKIIRSKQEERIQEIKWENDIIPFWFKKKKDNEIKKYFYQGVPRNLRGRIWLMCIGNNFSITRDYYDIEVQKGIEVLKSIQKEKNEVGAGNMISSKYQIIAVGKEHSIKYIEMDVERTYASLGIYSKGSNLRQYLQEILQAFVVSRPDIGYIQGLSYLAGMLLIYLDKFQAFVALMNIVMNPNIISFYSFNENQIQKRLNIFQNILKFNLPRVYKRFEDLDLRPEIYMVEWVMTIFSNNANVDITSRIWDLYMIEGIKAIYQAAIAIFTIRERDILNSDYCDCIKAVKYSLTEPNSIDEDTLINKMKETKFSDADLFEIQKLNDEYIPIY